MQPRLARKTGARVAPMAVNSTHPDYDGRRARLVAGAGCLAGEDAVKAGGEKYLPRLDSQTDEEFAAYVKRASFFNATARTSEAYQGLIFRRPPFVKLPEAWRWSRAGDAGVRERCGHAGHVADCLREDGGRVM